MSRAGGSTSARVALAVTPGCGSPAPLGHARSTLDGLTFGAAGPRPVALRLHHAAWTVAARRRATVAGTSPTTVEDRPCMGTSIVAGPCR